jgi:predicted MFS family arabinose efflux permease
MVGLATLGFMGTFLGSPLLTFLPVFAKDVLGGDVAQYTRLMSWAGAGAVAGALGVAWLGKFQHMGRAVLALQVAMGVVIILFANTRLPLANALLLFTGGACMVMVFATLQSLVQLRAPNELRGRVMSIYMMAFRGGMPLGSLVGGWLANQFTAPPVLTMNGALLALIAAWFLIKGHGVREL